VNGLVFIETFEDAHHFKESIYQKDACFNSVDIVSLNPNIRAYLRKNKIPCLSSSDILCDNYHDLILEKCKIFEGIIKHVFKENKLDVPDYYSNAVLYYLIFIWRHYLWNIELVFQAYEKKKYNFLSAYVHENVKTKSPWIEDDQLYLGEIVKRFAEHSGCKFIPMNGSPLKVQRSYDSQNRVLSNLKKLTLFPVYWLIVRCFLRERAILISNPAYNMDILCLALKQNNNNLVVIARGKYLSHLERIFSLFRILLNRFGIKGLNIEQSIDLDIPSSIFSDNPEGIKQRQKIIIGKITDSLNKNNNNFKHRDVYFYDLLIKKIKDDLVTPLVDMEIQSKGVKNLLKNLKPVSVLSQMNFGSNAAMGYYSSKMGIPSYLISHGSHVPHKNEYANREHEIIAQNILYGNYNHLVAQTPFAQEMILTKQFNTEIILNVHPILWGQKVVRKTKNKAGKFTIVHAGTPKFRHQRRLIYETSDEYVQALSEICDCVKNIFDIELIIKTRPLDYELTVNSLIELLSPLPSNVVIETSRPFSEVLAETDLLISFSSTTIEEALVNYIPVLLYGGHGRYAHIPVEPFSENNDNIVMPVTWVKSNSELAKYFKILSLKYNEFSETQLNFEKYIHENDDTVDFVDYFFQKIYK
jgi:hypothetical protein